MHLHNLHRTFMFLWKNKRVLMERMRKAKMSEDDAVKKVHEDAKNDAQHRHDLTIKGMLMMWAF